MALLALCLTMLLLVGNFAGSVERKYHGPRRPNCERYPSLGCPRDFRPVCGSDGNTYANECVLCAMIRETGQMISIIRDGPC